LLANEDLVDLARTRGGQIVVPTGALIGLDAVTAAAEGQIHSVRMVTRKPVKSLLGAPYLLENGIDIESIQEPLRVFTGSAREAAVGFPANLNVAVALSLAGIGPDRTQIEVWADPALERNTHRIEVEADSARFSMEIANVPSENNRTGRITALSVISWLKKTSAPLRVGS
jgi:aspartate dehydrogenase